MPYTIDNVLSNELINVVTRHDDMGTFEFQIGNLETIVTIDLGRFLKSENVKISTSHAIHTPTQIDPYRPSRRVDDDPAYALHRAISALTEYYRAAVDAGHEPEESWLVNY